MFGSFGFIGIFDRDSIFDTHVEIVNEEVTPVVQSGISTLFNTLRGDLTHGSLELNSDSLLMLIEYINEKWEESIDLERLILCVPSDKFDRSELLKIQNRICELERLNATLEGYRQYDRVELMYVLP